MGYLDAYTTISRPFSDPRRRTFFVTVHGSVEQLFNCFVPSLTQPSQRAEQLGTIVLHSGPSVRSRERLPFFLWLRDLLSAMHCEPTWSVVTHSGVGGSLYRWLTTPEPDPRLLSAWPLARLPNSVNRVNEPLTVKELEAVRWSIQRGSPFGNETCVESIARRFGLESTLRPRGRPQVRNLPNKDS